MRGPPGYLSKGEGVTLRCLGSGGVGSEPGEGGPRHDDNAHTRLDQAAPAYSLARRNTLDDVAP